MIKYKLVYCTCGERKGIDYPNAMQKVMGEKKESIVSFQQ